MPCCGRGFVKRNAWAQQQVYDTKAPAGIPAGGFFQGPRPLKPIEAAQPPAAYFSLVRKAGKSTLRGANQAGEGRALMICPLRTPILRGPRIGCASVSFRRANWDARSAAFRCRSIVLAYSASDYQTAPSLAHAVTRRDPRTRQFTANARRAAAENSGFEYRLTPTPDGMWSSP